MSRKKNPAFNEKQLKALALIEQGDFTLQEVAKQVGWKMDYLYTLYEGDTSKAGSVASLFSAECRKYDKKRDDQIKELTKKNKKLTNRLIHTVLQNIQDKIDRKRHVSLDEKKLLGTYMNCLAKSSPSVEIGSVSYSYTNGLTAEQLVYEYNRLRSLADGSSNRRAVQGTEPGGSRVLLEPVGSGSEVEEEQ